MSMQNQATPRPPAGFLRRAWALARPYWSSERRWVALGLLFGVLALAVANVIISVIINTWYQHFYNALQNKTFDVFWSLMGQFCLLAALGIAAAILQYYVNSILQLDWRRWMTRQYVNDWVKDSRYYQFELTGRYADNPDQRICEDIDSFSSLALSLFVGLFSSLLTIASFVTILWKVSGSLDFHLFGLSVHIPGYMLWVAILYCGLGSLIAHWIGKKLIGLYFTKQRVEANMRYDMIRLRENSRGVALMHGDAVERKRLGARFMDVWHTTRGIITNQKRLIGYNTGFNQIAIIFPIVAAAPKFFSGAITLGTLMQISTAFTQVQGGMGWFVSSYSDLANWRSIVERLSGFCDGLEKLKESNQASTHHVMQGDAPELQDFSLKLPDGKCMLTIDHLKLNSKENVLISAPSGTGKSLLFGVLAGNWPWWNGNIKMPESVLFLPQTPYLPIDTLAEVLAYPGTPDQYTREDFIQALHAVGLGVLESWLDDVEHWAHRLSPGEQQRISFARALLVKPKWLFLDEATAALDLDAEQALYRMLGEKMPDTTLISIAHKGTVNNFHSRLVGIENLGAA